MEPNGTLAGLSVPIAAALRSYSIAHLRHDLAAGLTVAAVTIPQAMGYALVAGLPPVVGLYTALITCAVAALFSPSRYLIHGPTNAIAIALYSALAELGIASPADRWQAAVTLSLLTGLLQVACAAFRVGDLTRFVSRGVLLGFMVAAAILISGTQLKHVLGMPNFPSGLPRWQAVLVALLTLTVLIGLRKAGNRLGIRLPEMFLALAAAGGLVWMAGWEDGTVEVVAGLSARLPEPRIPELSITQLRQLSGPALAIAILGLLEALAIAKALAIRDKTQVEPNQQCFSEGIANAVGALFGCMPGSGSFTRSAVNYAAGARSQLSGIFASLCVGMAILYLAPLAKFVPVAALGTILIVAAWRMVEWRDVVYFVRASRSDAAVLLTTAVAGVCISVEFAILAGTILSVLLYMPRAGRLYLSELVVTAEGVVRERTPADPVCSRLCMFNLEGELFFGSAPALEQAISLMKARIGPQTKALVLRLKRIRNPDATCLEILHGFLGEVRASGVTVFLCGVRPELAGALRRTGMTALVGHAHVYREQPGVWSSTLEAVRAAYALLGDELCEHCPRRHSSRSEAAWYYVI